MASNIDEQPKPKATDRKPMWPEVIAYVQRNYADDDGELTVTKLVADMDARHLVGIQRYGVPLTSGNGRDHLIDAYQEGLDMAVYLRTWLDERSIEPILPEAHATRSAKHQANDQERTVLYMFAATIEMLLQMRGMLK